jgi:hypothetical protein
MRMQTQRGPGPCLNHTACSWAEWRLELQSVLDARVCCLSEKLTCVTSSVPHWYLAQVCRTYWWLGSWLLGTPLDSGKGLPTRQLMVGHVTQGDCDISQKALENRLFSGLALSKNYGIERQLCKSSPGHFCPIRHF